MDVEMLDIADAAASVAGPSNPAQLSPRPGEASTSAMTMDSHPAQSPAAPSPVDDTPPLFFPTLVPGDEIYPFDARQNLFDMFRLAEAYKKHVAPYTPPVELLGAVQQGLGQTQQSSVASTGQGASILLPSLKGKEKEIVVNGLVPAATTNGAQDQGMVVDEDYEKKKRKRETNYKHLIKPIIGKHSSKKDDYLIESVLVPPKQKMTIHEFDERTQREAFAVSLDGLKGWNIHALVQESEQAKEDRRRRKEAKRALAAAQAAAASNPAGGVSGTTNGTGIAISGTSSLTQSQTLVSGSLSQGTTQAPSQSSQPFAAPTPALTPYAAAATPGSVNGAGAGGGMQSPAASAGMGIGVGAGAGVAGGSGGGVSTPIQRHAGQVAGSATVSQQHQQRIAGGVGTPIGAGMGSGVNASAAAATGKRPATPMQGQQSTQQQQQPRGTKRPASPAILGQGPPSRPMSLPIGVGVGAVGVAQKKRRVDLPGTPTTNGLSGQRPKAVPYV